jgi:predicted RecA/RadA family phage recombinase
MSTTQSQPGQVVQWTNGTGAAVAVGIPVVVDSGTAGVTQVAIGIGATGAVNVGGVHILAKAASETWAPGDRVYWSVAAGNVSKTPSAARFFIGFADQIAADAATSGRVRIRPFAEHGPLTLAITATTTLAAHHFAGGAVLIETTTTGGAITLNLPALATVPGALLTVYNVAGTNAVTIDPAASEQINGGATFATIDAANDRATFAAGTAWRLVTSTIA